MASVERVISKRKGLRVRLQLALDQLQNALDDSTSSIAAVDGAVTKVQNLTSDLNIVDEEVVNVLDPEDIENDVIECAKYSDPVYPLIAAANLKRESIRTGSLTPSHHSETSRSSTSSQCKLPKFELQSFSGDPLSWQGFWDQFSTAIHENCSLTDIDRFNYLKRYLKDQASDTISGLTLSSENYKEAIEILRSRFGNPQVLISAHVESLLKASRIKNKEDIKGLRKLYNDIESCIRNLKTLRLDITGYGCVLIPILKAKLPDDLNIIIARKFGDDIWTLEQLMKYFHGELRAQENCGLSDQSASHGRRQQSSPYTASGLLTESDSVSKLCVFCDKGMHNSSKCRTVTNSASRWEIIKQKGLCFICLGAGHKARSCKTKYSCRICQKRHNVALCTYENKNDQAKHTTSCCTHNDTTLNNEGETSVFHSHASGGILLQTAWVDVSNPEVQCGTKTRVLFDSGSQRSYISEEVRKKLRAPTIRKEIVTLNTFGASDSKARNLDVVKVKVNGKAKSIFIEALCVPEVCNPIKGQNISFARERYTHLKNLSLADGILKSSTTFSIGILIGVDSYHDFFSGKVLKGNEGPVASETVCGWVLSGMLGDRDFCDSESHSMKCAVEIKDDLREDLKKFWEIENVNDDDCVVEQFKTDIDFDGERYVTRLPFRSTGHDKLSDNFISSKRRLENLKPKLLKQGIFEKYDKIFSDYEKEKIIERVPSAEEPKGCGVVHYLPHRPVVREDKSTTKIRAVFDASAATQGVSLNDCLYPGPNLLSKIFDILLRFRLNKIAILADIKQAFLNIGIHKEDQDFLRFLWFENEGPDSEIIVFRFLRVLFGLTCSPFLLNGTIRHHLSQYISTHKEFVLKFIEDLYVDDTTSGCASINEGKEFFHNASKILKEGAFELRKWKSNDPELQAFFDKNSKVFLPGASDDITFSQAQLGTSDSQLSRVLGVGWDTKSDEFVFDLQNIVYSAQATAMTKRKVLKLSASIYDPLGYLCPITARLKTIFQMLCMDKLDWDEQIPNNIKKVWEDAIQAINQIKCLRLPRFALFDSIHLIEIYGFSDASKNVYCGVVYLRIFTKTGGIQCSFLCSKSKVAPIKTTSIPRLELLGCELLSKLVKDVKTAMSGRIEISKICCWSDSKVALYWLKGRDKIWKPWVENRVDKIRKAIPECEWNHVRGELNPADIPTRSIGDKFDEDIWKNFCQVLNIRWMKTLMIKR